MKWSRKIGVTLLCIYLIVLGVLDLIPALRFNGSQNILGLLAIAAGVLFWLDR